MTAPDHRPGEQVSERWSQWRESIDLDDYAARFKQLEGAGQTPHGEADFVESFHPGSVLDAGCGMGRVAIELARRGIDVVGVDLDEDLLAFARRQQPSVEWVYADLSTLHLGRHFDVVAMPGNVMIFCRSEHRAPIIRRAAEHLDRDGLLIAGFELERRSDALTLAEYDAGCNACGLQLAERWATWSRHAYEGGPYAVSVHRRIGDD